MRQLTDRFVALLNERAFDAFHEVFAPDVRIVDRRLVGWGELKGSDAYAEVVRGFAELAPDTQIKAEPLALGARATVVRYLTRGHAEAGGGEFEIETVAFSVLDEGRVKYTEMFEGSDADLALARFEEIGAQTEPERVASRWARLINARNWDAIEDLFTEGFELIDHRVLGWEPLRGPEAPVDLYRSSVEIVPDFEMRFEVLAGDDEYIAMRAGGYGSAAADAGGGPVELVVVLVSTVRDGRFSRGEQFEADDEARALARLEELRADRR